MQKEKDDNNTQAHSSWTWSGAGKVLVGASLAALGIFAAIKYGAETDRKVLKNKTVGMYIGGSDNTVTDNKVEGYDVGIANVGRNNSTSNNSMKK